MRTTRPPDPKKPTPPVLGHVLRYLGILLAIATLGGAMVALTTLSATRSRIDLQDVLLLGTLLVSGLTAAAVLLAIGAIVRCLHRADSILTRLEGGARDASLGDTTVIASPAADAAQIEGLRRLLEELRTDVLATEEQRQQKRERLLKAERDEFRARIDYAISTSQFAHARQCLIEMQQQLGSDDETRRFDERIEAAITQAQANDISGTIKQCEDLMGLRSWDQAVRVAQELTRRHPTSPEAEQIHARVLRERELYLQQHRSRLYMDVERFSSRRQWSQALAAANQLLDAYPESSEAQTLRPQLNTLSTNAEIEQRRELEEHYKELCNTHRYAEALGLARNIMRQYPDSPQAKALRAHLPSLEKQAKEQAR